MATAAVDSADHLHHLYSESLHSIDLHHFSQADLLSLSLCSASSSLDLRNHTPGVSAPEIDPSVFNESAGSRKQTFSRLRLAPRSGSQFSPASVYGGGAHRSAEQALDDDSRRIVAILKAMVGGDSFEVSHVDDNLVQFNRLVENGVSDCYGDSEMKQMEVEGSSRRKRKRGSYKINRGVDDSLNQGNQRSASGVNMRVEELRNTEDPYAREVNRRTVDMQTREQLLEFLQGLDGEWLSNRKKRKIVGASVLGDFLPKEWKIMLCLMKRAGYFWVDCRRFISPNGQQFMSCKEALSYLNSPLGLQDASQLSTGQVDVTIQMTENKSPGNAADLTLNADKNDGALVCYPAVPLPESVVQEKDSAKVEIPGHAETMRIYRCHKCTMVFDEPDDLLQHFLSSHKGVPKRVRQETLNEEVILNNGRYQCQFCDKSYDERHRYNGHLGNHIKDYFKRTQAAGGATGIQTSAVPSPVAAHPSALKTQESTGTDAGSVATNSDVQINNENDDVVNCKIQENATDESDCWKQAMIDDKPRDSNDIAVGNNSVPEGSSQCSHGAADMEQVRAPDNSENQRVNSIEGHEQKIGSDCNLVAPTTIEDGGNSKDILLPNAISSTGSDGKDFVKEDGGHTAFGNNGSSLEDVAANSIEHIDFEGCLLVPSGISQKYASVNDVPELPASTTVDMTYESGSQVGRSSPLDEKGAISFDKVEQVSATAMEDSRYDDMSGSSNNVLPVGSGCNDVTVEDFATGNELESSGRSCLVIPSWNGQASYAENEMNGSKLGSEKKSEGEQLTFFVSEQSLGSENTITKNSCDTRVAADHSEGVDLVASRATAVELDSVTSNSLLVPSGNELTFSLKENKVLNGTLENHQQRNSDSNSHIPSFDDQISTYDNNLKMNSLFAPKQKEVRNFFEGGMHVAFDSSQIEQDAGAVESTLQESYSSLGQWDAAGVNVTGQYCSPLDEQKQASANGSLSLSCSIEDWGAGSNLDMGFTGEVREKLKVVKPRKNDAYSSNIQASENIMSDFMWKHGEEPFRSYIDPSQVANSSGGFTTYDLSSDKVGNELFGEKFGSVSGFEGIRSGNMDNMEYRFMIDNSEPGKAFPNDTEIVQRPSSSAWLDKEALPLLPKIASRQQVPALCVWCKNEFHYDVFEPETQIGSPNFTCASCKARCPSNFTVL